MGPLHLLTWCLLCLVHSERLASHPKHSHVTRTVTKNTSEQERLDRGPKNMLMDNRLGQVLYQHEHRGELHHQHKNNNNKQASTQSSRQTGTQANAQDKTFTHYLRATHDAPSVGQQGPYGGTLEIAGRIDTTGVTVWIQGRQVSVVKGIRCVCVKATTKAVIIS